VIPPALADVVRLLPVPASDVRQLGRPGRPWSIRYGSRQAVLRWNDASRWRSFGFSETEGMASIEWAHRVLGDLASTGFVAPGPIADLDGRSFAVTVGGVWELLSHVPGRPMGWTDAEFRAAGALLAQFHIASQKLPKRSQRPGAQPFADCVPSHADARVIRASFEREWGALDPADAVPTVIHGDATQSNVVIADNGTFHLVDFALMYEECLYGDIGAALWRNGRSSADAITYDTARVARFVSGYHAERPLSQGAARAIVTSMKGRGLQLQHRLELRRGRDESVMQRLLAVQESQTQLVTAIEAVLG
jgi:Ser/Thr protein kinase RdoA (MazF antagonist)